MAESTEKPAAAAQPARPAQTHVAVDDTKALASYANFCRVTGTPEELIIDFGLNAQQPGSAVEAVHATQRIITNFYTAKRLLQALHLTLQRHEAAFGVIETDVQKRDARFQGMSGTGKPSTEKPATDQLATGRLSTGVPGLDDCLGGGLVPGTLAVVVGASGIGKTQLGIQFAQAGLNQERRRGVVFDMNARIDPQSHAEYAQRMFSWQLQEVPGGERPHCAEIFQSDYNPGDYLHVFERSGRRVTQRDMGFDAWHDWQAELAAKLESTIAFFYGNFIRGVRRSVIDGIEPAERPSESIQFELFEYIYHQILRKDYDWVARDLLRESFRANLQQVEEWRYDWHDVGCLLLYTSHEMLLDDLIARPLADGELVAGANTLILLGKIRRGDRLDRGLFIAKHRGSAASDEIHTYRITDAGLTLD